MNFTEEIKEIRDRITPLNFQDKEYEIIKDDPELNYIELQFKDVTSREMGFLRRSLINKVPSLAFFMFDFIKWRTISAKQELVAMKFEHLSIKQEGGLDVTGELPISYKSSAILSFNATEERQIVYGRDIKFTDKTLSLVENERDEALLYLNLGDEIHLEMTVVRGEGKTHIRWSPYVLSRYEAIAPVENVKLTQYSDVPEICPGRCDFLFTLMTKRNYTPMDCLEWVFENKSVTDVKDIYNKFLNPGGIYESLAKYISYFQLDMEKVLNFTMPVIPIDGVDDSIRELKYSLYWIYFIFKGVNLLRGVPNFRGDMVDDHLTEIVDMGMKIKQYRKYLEDHVDPLLLSRLLLEHLSRVIISEDYWDIGVGINTEAVTAFHRKALNSFDIPENKGIPTPLFVTKIIKSINIIRSETFDIFDVSQFIRTKIRMKDITIKDGLIYPASDRILMQRVE